ncbi:hypothetical protein [Actinophytocola sp.]
MLDQPTACFLKRCGEAATGVGMVDDEPQHVAAYPMFAEDDLDDIVRGV